MALLMQGFASVWNAQSLLLIVAGVSVGILFGSIPGLTANMAVVLCLPLSYSLPPLPGLTLLVSLYIGGTSGGLISAILLGVPGTPASVATCFDGLPMCKNGEAGRALAIGILYSFIGCLLSFMILVTLAPAISRFALRFGPFEYAAVAIFSLMTVSSLIQGSVEKGLISCVLGLMLATVGATPVDATPRFTMGIANLNNGFSTVPALIGLFAVSEVIKLAEHRDELGAQDYTVTTRFRMRFPGVTWKEFREQFGNMLRSMLIGTGIGILPGIGAGVSNLVSYAAARSASREPQKFGTGC
ncbi:MAG: tripartite tricarboxylate transporter permease, partial [Oscillospiraceae bacterium]|nr:tripartite tricarboxylate transporter permease [Oscillospiraceae bacterium]